MKFKSNQKIPVPVCSDVDPICWKQKNPCLRLQFLENTDNWVFYGVIFWDVKNFCIACITIWIEETLWKINIMFIDIYMSGQMEKLFSFIER